MLGLARTRVTPDALTACGVGLCVAAAVLVFFENRNEILFYWLAAGVFVVGSILDILDGALARTSGKGTPFGAFLDSTTDRVSEAAVLGAIALVFSRHGETVALALDFAAVAGSFLVSYTRARAEALGLRGDVGIGGRAGRAPGESGSVLLRVPPELKERLAARASERKRNLNDLIVETLSQRLGKEEMASTNGKAPRGGDKVRVALIGVGNCANSLLQ